MNASPQRFVALTALGLLWSLPACSNSDSGGVPPVGTLNSELGGLGFNQFSAALSTTGLDGTLEQSGPFTVFAPTDDAFSRVPSGAIGASGGLATLEDALRQHILTGQSNAADLRGTFSAASLGGEVIVDEVDGVLFINNARVTRADVPASNGVIHELDEVLLPPRDLLTTLQGRGFSTLVTALQAAQLDTTLQGGGGSFTVLAPTDAAFAALDPAVLTSLLQPQNAAQLTELLEYHVVRQKLYASQAVASEFVTTLGGADTRFVTDGTANLTANDVRVSSINIPCTNGFIHVIDAVLTPPAGAVDLAQARGLNTFASLAAMANLDGVLAGTRRATVLAPTDAAFAALPASTTMFLTDPANVAVLRDVLSYHVLDGSRTLAEIAAETSISSVTGEAIAVDPSGLLNGNALGVTDLLTREGLLHELEGVLIPAGIQLP